MFSLTVNSYFLHECQCYCKSLGFICSINNQEILYDRGSRYALDLTWRFAPCSLPGYSVRSAKPLRRRVTGGCFPPDFCLLPVPFFVFEPIFTKFCDFSQNSIQNKAKIKNFGNCSLSHVT